MAHTQGRDEPHPAVYQTGPPFSIGGQPNKPQSPRGLRGHSWVPPAVRAHPTVGSVPPSCAGCGKNHSRYPTGVRAGGPPEQSRGKDLTFVGATEGITQNFRKGETQGTHFGWGGGRGRVGDLQEAAPHPRHRCPEPSKTGTK